MAIQITPLHSESTPAHGIEVAWRDSQFVMVVTDKGLVACGVVDKDVMERAGAAIAIARGTPDHPLVTIDDLLSATIQDVTAKAAQYGVTVGMTGREALAELSD
jgi:uncharacterized protein YunC (DUF1805 family)